MDEISNAELLELFFVAQEFVEAQFQYWMSISFAAIVGVFVAGDRLDARVRYLLAGLYLLATALFVLRYIGAVGELGLVAEEASRRALRGTGDMAITVPIVMVRIALFLLGTGAATWFLLRGAQVRADDA